MRMIRITDDKKDEMSGLVEKMLHYGGKLMTCLESLDEDGEMGERSYRHMGMRDEDDYPDYDRMGERRDRRGRYSRY